MFDDNITPSELNRQLSELLLIDEVRKYIESEKVKHMAGENNDIDINMISDIDSDDDICN